MSHSVDSVEKKLDEYFSRHGKQVKNLLEMIFPGAMFNRKTIKKSLPTINLVLFYFGKKDKYHDQYEELMMFKTQLENILTKETPEPQKYSQDKPDVSTTREEQANYILPGYANNQSIRSLLYELPKSDTNKQSPQKQDLCCVVL